MVERFNDTSILFECLMAPGKSFPDQLVGLAPQGTGNFVQVKLWMILHAPKHAGAVPDLDRLNLRHRIAGQQCRPFGQRLDLIRMERRGIERGWSPGQKRMIPSCIRQGDAAGKPCFPPVAAGADRATRSNGGDMQAGTGSKGRHTRREHSPHQLHFPACLRGVLVKVKGRSRHEDRIIAPKRRPVGERRTSVGRLDPVANRIGCEQVQGFDVCFPGASSHALTAAFPGLGRFTFRDEETQWFWHVRLSGAQGVQTAGQRELARTSRVADRLSRPNPVGSDETLFRGSRKASIP